MISIALSGRKTFNKSIALSGFDRYKRFILSPIFCSMSQKVPPNVPITSSNFACVASELLMHSYIILYRPDGKYILLNS